MTQSSFSESLISVLLSWLKGLAAWVLKLFNLAGGASPLEWLSEHWIPLLALLLIIGIAADFIVWMLRWRPYWVWFNKKQIIINDERMLDGEDQVDMDPDDELLEHSYVVSAEEAARLSSAPRASDDGARRSTRRYRPQSGSRSRGDLLTDDLFEVGRDMDAFSDFSEDEVFNVSSLPDKKDDRGGRRRR